MWKREHLVIIFHRIYVCGNVFVGRILNAHHSVYQEHKSKDVCTRPMESFVIRYQQSKEFGRFVQFNANVGVFHKYLFYIVTGKVKYSVYQIRKKDVETSLYRE